MAFCKENMPQDTSTAATVKEIKRSFRSMMNGVIAASQRDKGVTYKVNWGAQLPHLVEFAQKYPKNHELAAMLWREDIRECKIMAALLMPVDEMTRTEADAWVHDITSVEMAEVCTFYLFRHLPDALSIASEWLYREQGAICQVCAYHIYAYHFSQITDRKSNALPQEQRFLHTIVQSLQSSNASLRHAAYNCMMRYVSLNKDTYNKMKTVISTTNLDIL